MFEVTEAARKQVVVQVEGMEKAPIRIFLNTGCGGPAILMGLDEKIDTDLEFMVEDFQYIIDRELMDSLKAVTVDFNDGNFIVSAEEEPPSICRACESASNCSDKQ